MFVCFFFCFVQRAEHHDATCRRVQNRDSDRNRFTQIDFAHTSEPSIATSSVPASEYSENHQNLQLRTSKGSFSVKSNMNRYKHAFPRPCKIVYVALFIWKPEQFEIPLMTIRTIFRFLPALFYIISIQLQHLLIFY